MSGGTVYYIGCPETNRVKIGFTMGDPEARLNTLRTGAPTDIRLMAMHNGTFDDERHMHRKFAHLRLHGEWFRMAEELAEHMFLICWLEAVQSRNLGRKAPDWARIGLLCLDDEENPLPDDIRAAL